MGFESFQAPTPPSEENADTEKSFFEVFYNRLSENERNIIEAELFNSPDSIPLDTALKTISDPNEARQMMNLLREYLDKRPDELSKRKEFASWISENVSSFVKNRLDGPDDTLAA